MREIHIIDGVRTPHGAFLGDLASVSAVELGRTAVDGLLDRIAVPPERVDWVALGNAISAGVGQVPARQVVVGSDLDASVPATTINEASGSGLRAVALAADRIDAGRSSVALAGGAESMSNAPHLLGDLRQGRRHGDAKLVDSMITDGLWDPTVDAHMGELTEDLVERFGITRAAQDAYAVESHQRAARAVSEGLFDDEVVPVTVDGEAVRRDEGPRPDTSVETLGRLDPAFDDDGTITAGNASDLSDGAGCVCLADAETVADLGVDTRARIVDYAVAYREPRWFGMSVADAVEALLDANGVGVDEVDVFELNEAFAAQMVYVMDRLDVPHETLNPRGGAVSLGHPIGASGGILLTSLLYTLADWEASLGVVGMSIGGGGGIAMLVER